MCVARECLRNLCTFSPICEIKAALKNTLSHKKKNKLSKAKTPKKQKTKPEDLHWRLSKFTSSHLCAPRRQPSVGDRGLARPLRDGRGERGGFRPGGSFPLVTAGGNHQGRSKTPMLGPNAHQLRLSRSRVPGVQKRSRSF